MRTKFIFIFLLSYIHAGAQNTISLNKAVELALQNNFDLLIAGNELRQAQNNNIPGNAGMLPSVSLNVNDNPSLSNINQKFTNGTVIERNNVFSNSLGAGISISYTLFDGNRMFATKRKLETLDVMAANRLKVNVQQLITSVIFNYSNIVRHKQYLDVLKQLQDMSTQRLDIVTVREQAGLANNTDLYLARLDLEARKQQVLSQEVVIQKAYTDLNLLMNLKADSVYNTEVPALPPALVKTSLDSLLKNNPEWLMAADQCEVAVQTQKEISAARLPLIRLNAAYNYNLSQSQAGFSLYNQMSGPQAGLTLSMPLFSGGVNKANIENAKLDVQNSEWQKEQTIQRINGLYEQAWIEYEAAHRQLISDSASMQMASSYIALMQKRFEMGQSTVLELREAQRTYEETVYRYYSNIYLLRMAETQLLGLTGQLVK